MIEKLDVLTMSSLSRYRKERLKKKPELDATWGKRGCLRPKNLNIVEHNGLRSTF